MLQGNKLRGLNPKKPHAATKKPFGAAKKTFNTEVPEIILSDSEDSATSDDSAVIKKLAKQEDEADLMQDLLFMNYKMDQEHRRQETLKIEFESKIQDLYEEFNEKIKHASFELHQMTQDTASSLLNAKFPDIEPRTSLSEYKSCAEKKFQYKESMLTVMFEKDQSITTLYHIAFAAFTIFVVNLILNEYKQTGELIDLKTIASIFNSPEVVFNIWIRIFVGHLLIIYFTRWVHFSNPSSYLWKPLYLSFHASLLAYSAYSSLNNNLGFASAMIVISECARMCMKMHSYFRNKMLYGSDRWKEFRSFSLSSQSSEYKPRIEFHSVSKEFNKYMYFHFAPTLIYRDSYIKGPPTNYKKAAFHLANFATCVYFTYIFFKTYCMPLFSKTGLDAGSWNDFISSAFTGIVPGATCLFILFFGLLHCWLNCFAELLRFPDRHFYEDWWTSKTFATFFRKPNLVLYEWFYYYVYLDIMRFSKMKIKSVPAKILTFFFSALLHELILSVSVGFFYPILKFLFFVPGVILISRGKRVAHGNHRNILFWFFLYIGVALLTVLYSREFYARRDSQVNPKIWGTWYYIAPRFLLALLEKYNYII